MKKKKIAHQGLKVVPEALQEWETIQEIGKQYEVHHKQIST